MKQNIATKNSYIEIVRLHDVFIDYNHAHVIGHVIWHAHATTHATWYVHTICHANVISDDIWCAHAIWHADVITRFILHVIWNAHVIMKIYTTLGYIVSRILLNLGRVFRFRIVSRMCQLEKEGSPRFIVINVINYHHNLWF